MTDNICCVPLRRPRLCSEKRWARTLTFLGWVEALGLVPESIGEEIHRYSFEGIVVRFGLGRDYYTVEHDYSTGEYLYPNHIGRHLPLPKDIGELRKTLRDEKARRETTS